MRSAVECKLKADNYAFMAQQTDDEHLRKLYFRLSSIWRNKALRMLMATASECEKSSEAG